MGVRPVDCHVIACLVSTVGGMSPSVTLTCYDMRNGDPKVESEWDLLYKSAFGLVLLPCGRIVRDVFPQGDPVLTEFTEHTEGFDFVSVRVHAECFRPLFGAQAQGVIGGERVGWGREDGRRGDPRNCGKRWELDAFPRMVARGPIVLRAETSHERLGKQGRMRSLHIRGTIGLVPFGGCVA